MQITDLMRQMKAIELLTKNCERFKDTYNDLVAGNEVKGNVFSQLLITLTGAGYADAAKSLVDRFVEEENKELYLNDIQKYADENYRPCSCPKQDCTEDEIRACQGKITYNNGQGDDKKVNNSCAFFITPNKVSDACKIDLAIDIVDEMLDEAIGGNRTILMEENSIEALTILYKKANIKYMKVIDELKEAKIPIGDLKKLVEMNNKKQEKDNANFVGAPATEDDVCDVLKPYIPFFESPSDYMSKDGTIYTQDKDGEIAVSNFFPLITEKLTVDDGKEPEVYYNVTPICNARTEMDSILIPALAFKSSS